MSHDRVYRFRFLDSASKILQTEISRAFGLWFIAGIICLAVSFAWMSLHYHADRPHRTSQDTASAVLGSSSEP
jgi:hypothetical protein